MKTKHQKKFSLILQEGLWTFTHYLSVDATFMKMFFMSSKTIVFYRNIKTKQVAVANILSASFTITLFLNNEIFISDCMYTL